MSSPLTPPSSMADLDRQHQQELHQQHMRHVSSPSPVRTSEPILGLAQSALPAVSSPTTDKHPKGKRKRTAYVHVFEALILINPVGGTLAVIFCLELIPIDPKQACCAAWLTCRVVAATSTKDKMILEEAYSINPKPDKQARLEIVNRVSLNEKEVQVCHAL